MSGERERLEAWVGEKVIYGDVKAIVDMFYADRKRILEEIEKLLEEVVESTRPTVIREGV